MESKALDFKWFSNQVEREAKREFLSGGERIGEAVSIVATVVFIAFIAIHQTRPTGFFTDDSAPALVYLVLVYGMVPPAMRLFLGRRNVARPLEAIGMAMFFAVGLYFLITFPFDMSRFAQPLPHNLEFLLEWISATLAKWVLAIGVIACAFFAPYTFLLYLSIRGRLSGSCLEEPVGERPAE